MPVLTTRTCCLAIAAVGLVATSGCGKGDGEGGSGGGGATPCDDVSQCPDGDVCTGGRCLTPGGDCSPTTCEVGLTCVGGACAYLTCETEGDCGGGRSCERNTCLDSACEGDGDCAAGVCDVSSGMCGCPAECSECDPITFACPIVLDCVQDGDCQDGEMCVDNSCLAPPPCEGDGDCEVAAGEICEAGECILGCRDDSACGDGEICDGVMCFEGCRDNSGCEYPQVCQIPMCITPDCIDDMLEPNDSQSEATNLTPGEPLEGLICELSPDWYDFDVAAGCTMTARVTVTPPAVPPEISIYDPTGVLLSESARGAGIRTAVARSLTSDRHAIRVDFTEESSLRYLVSIDLTECP